MINIIDEKLKAWQSQYQNLLNVEFPWNAAHLCEETLVEGLAIRITTEMVSEAISKMKSGKAAGSLGIIIEMTNAVGDRIVNCLTSLFNQT